MSDLAVDRFIKFSIFTRLCWIVVNILWDVHYYKSKNYLIGWFVGDIIVDILCILEILRSWWILTHLQNPSKYHSFMFSKIMGIFCLFSYLYFRSIHTEESFATIGLILFVQLMTEKLIGLIFYITYKCIKIREYRRLQEFNNLALINI